MAGLDPAIHVLSRCRAKDVDARHGAGHDELDDNARFYWALFEFASEGLSISCI